MARKRFSLWFDRDKDADIIAAIPVLKSKNKFTGVVRDGMRLIMDLRAGKLDVLFELFPWVKSEFLTYMREVQPETSDVQRQLDRLLMLMEANPRRGEAVELALEDNDLELTQVSASLVDVDDMAAAFAGMAGGF